MPCAVKELQRKVRVRWELEPDGQPVRVAAHVVLGDVEQAHVTEPRPARKAAGQSRLAGCTSQQKPDNTETTRKYRRHWHVDMQPTAWEHARWSSGGG